MTVRSWSELTTCDFSAFDPEKTVVIFPVGSTEQHGPHLPVSVDTAITDGIVKRVMELTPKELSVLVLPTMPVGKSNEHNKFKGTLTLSVTTLINLWTEIAESVFAAGFKKLLFINGHGGQTSVSGIVARDLRVKHNTLVVAVNWWSTRSEPTLYSKDEYQYGIHGGAEETSVMLHLRPDLVRKNEIKNFVPMSLQLAEKYPHLLAKGVRFGWQAQDLHNEGACGNATIASAEHGKAIIDEAAQSLVELIREMETFPMTALQNLPD